MGREGSKKTWAAWRIRRQEADLVMLYGQMVMVGLTT